MKTILKSALLLFFMAFCIQSCQDNDDVAAPADVQINSFIWTGLNAVYLWQPDVPNLADNRFANENDFNNFLRGYAKPEDLFEDLLNKPESKYPNGDAIDRFSWIVSDYTVLEQELNGITKNSGIDFRLSRQTSGSNNLVGYVRYVIPNSNASSNNEIKRGDLFTSVNGTPLTASNYEALLLNSDSFTLNLASYNGASFVLTGKSVSLTKTILEENPILIKKVIDLPNNHKVGYLMYNGFYSDYDEQLNAAFADFAGVKDFILDLRYNGGGSVHSSTLLASMITGKFPGQIFSKRQYNAKLMKDLTSEELESLNERFVSKTDKGDAINSIGMTTVYIITTDNTASASEMVINGLKPYVKVVQVGETTVGKNVGSFTVYDSPSLNKKDVNPNHKYAMQPLVFKITNSVGFGDYTQGLTPNFEQFEYIDNYGVLGDPNEPLLALALSQITGVTAKKIQSNKILHLPYFADSKKNNKFKNEMYLDKIPTEFQKR